MTDVTLAHEYEKVDDIPEPFRPLYEERGGKHMLTKITGITTQADLTRVTRALDAEKSEKTRYKTQWDGFFGDKKPDDIKAQLDRIPELETIAASKNINDEKLNELADNRARSKIAPLERDNATLKTQLAERDDIIQRFMVQEETRSIHDSIRAVAAKSKVIDTAMEDVLMLAERCFEINDQDEVVTKDLPGQTPGLRPDVWLTEMQNKRPHWWPASKGGGAGGSGTNFGGSDNPWSHGNWNLTKQGQIMRENPEKAKQLASLAGSSVGGMRPAAAK